MFLLYTLDIDLSGGRWHKTVNYLHVDSIIKSRLTENLRCLLKMRFHDSLLPTVIPLSLLSIRISLIYLSCRVCHACIASPSLTSVHGKEGFVMHAWQRKVCHECSYTMAKKGLSCMHGKRGFVMHAWQRSVCHTWLAKEGLSWMHVKRGFVMHAWQKRVCHACMAKEGLSYMIGKGGFVSHGKGGFFSHGKGFLVIHACVWHNTWWFVIQSWQKMWVVLCA